MSKPPPIVSLSKLPENTRIEHIAAAVKTGAVVGFIVEAEPGKALRYIAKLEAKCPGVKTTQHRLTPGTILIKALLPKDRN
jgi:hypothetical protein